MATRAVMSVLAAALVGGLAGCGASAGIAGDGAAGSGGGDASTFCSAFSACGGDLVGTWRSNRSCAAPTRVSGTICQGETFDFAKVENELTWTFRADGSLTATLATVGAASVTAPSPCVGAGGATIACADVGAKYATIFFAGTKITAGACHEAGGLCTCPLTLTAGPTGVATGTYTTAGSTLTFGFGAESGTFSYCAAGPTLRMHADTTGDPTKVAVYDKQ